MSQEPDPRLIAEALSNPFPPDVVKFRAGKVSGSRALAMAYIDARIVMDRLDDVLGFLNWRDHYEVLASGDVVCTLAIRVNGEWLEKSDVGGESEQPDAGDRMKAAFSDALKRAAVKFGIGRYLYSLKSSWVDFDPQKKQLKNHPELPAWAQPAEAPQAPEFLTHEELAEMKRLVQEAEDVGLAKSLETFWKWLAEAKVTTLEEMPAKMFKVASKGLQSKIDAAKKAKVTG